MASIEFIQNRVAGAEKKLEKLQAKMERIRKAEATGWEENPYYYSELDKRSTEKEIAKAEKNLEKYRAELATAQEKAESRNVTVIIEFLNEWKRRTVKYCEERLQQYIEAMKEYYEKDSKFCEMWNKSRINGMTNEIKEARAELNETKRMIHERFGYLIPYIYGNKLNIEKLTKDLDNEANAKYDFMIERTNEITGKITDASNLEIGGNGELNGYIIGERGAAKVQTIGAGGYNIQRFHFRTLIHEMK